MDPTATLLALHRALKTKDFSQAKNLVQILLTWKRAGGFPPTGTKPPIIIMHGLFAELAELQGWITEET